MNIQYPITAWMWALLGCSTPKPAPTSPPTPEVASSVEPADSSPPRPKEQPPRARPEFEEIDAAIRELWSWWGGLSHAQQGGLIDRSDPVLAEELSRRAKAVHSRFFFWSAESIGDARYRLVFPTNGVPDPYVALVGQRLLKDAPHDDLRWTFRTKDEPLGNEALMHAEIRIDELTIDYARLRFGLEYVEDVARFKVTLWHPDVPTGDPVVTTVVSTSPLVAALGWSGRVSWIQSARIVDVRPPDDMSVVEFAQAVREFAQRAPSIPMEHTEEIDPDTQLRSVVERSVGLRRWDNLGHDTWCEITIPYDAGADGQPTPSAQPRLREFDSTLREVLGADAVWVGRSMADGQLRLWLYLDGDSDADARVREQVTAQATGAHMLIRFDPNWCEAPAGGHTDRYAKPRSERRHCNRSADHGHQGPIQTYPPSH